MAAEIISFVRVGMAMLNVWKHSYMLLLSSERRGNKLFLSQTEWRVTTKPGKLFITFFNEPRAPFEIPAMKNAIRKAYRLADGAPLELKSENGRTSFNMERPMIDPMATVVVVEFEGERVQR